ncbi:MAG: hypothetical protein R6V67_01750 [Spirochaetia bacterium]
MNSLYIKKTLNSSSIIFWVLTSLTRGGAAVAAILLLSCGPLPDSREFLERDIHPPVFLGAGAPDEETFELIFNEEGDLSKQEISIYPETSMESVGWQGETCRITLSETMQPGVEYALEGTLRDEEGNSLTFLTHVFGYNPNLPALRLNEITTQGSTTNPDKVEIKVLEAGNTAGLCLYEGVDTSWTNRKVLPPIEVEAEDYIVVHFRPAGTSDEIDEIEDSYECSADKAIPGAWDLWMEGSSGISSNNGVIALYESTTGPLIDGFLYSNRTSSSDEKYRGFGTTRALERADILHEQGGWEAKERFVAPEDAVDPDDSTATRSMCRIPEGLDTDTAEDWHIVPTRGSTFGSLNSEEVYEP